MTVYQGTCNKWQKKGTTMFYFLLWYSKLAPRVKAIREACNLGRKYVFSEFSVPCEHCLEGLIQFRFFGCPKVFKLRLSVHAHLNCVCTCTIKRDYNVVKFLSLFHVVHTIYKFIHSAVLMCVIDVYFDKTLLSIFLHSLVCEQNRSCNFYVLTFTL